MKWKDPGNPPGALGGTSKLTINLVAAGLSTLLAFWMTVADFFYGGDLLFQDSFSMLAVGLYLSTLFMVLLALAVLPKRIVIGLNLLIVCRGAMGWPLSLVMDHSLACRIISLSLLGLSGYHLAASLRPSRLRIGQRPWLNLRHSIISIISWIAIGILSIPVCVLGYVEAGKSIMGDYVQFSWDGISLVERVFEKDDQIVHLVGMMHIGDGSFYTSVNQRIHAAPEEGRRIVLTEGVADRSDLLPAEFKSGQTYAKLARSLGLDLQQDLAGINPSQDSGKGSAPAPGRTTNAVGVVFENADIDISDLAEADREILVAILDMLDTDNLLNLLFAHPENVTSLEVERLLFEGLIGGRNDALMERFKKSAPGFSEVFIPWGAAHLPGIEEDLLALGYTQKEETRYPVVRFWGK